MAILSVNIGSSSAKFALYAAESHGIGALLGSGQIDNLQPGGAPQWHWQIGATRVQESLACQHPDNPHQDALRHLQHWLQHHFADTPLTAVVHRVVHGGDYFDRAVWVNDEVMAKLAGLNRLAPLHQPHNLAGITRFQAAFKNVPQVACFDTAFHAGLSPLETTFAIPAAETAAGIRRYGFHGLSYQYVAAQMAAASPRAQARMVMLHLGNGSSACATVNGRSSAMSMGFTALDGLMMGSRCGYLDAGVVLHWLAEGKDHAAIEKLLYKQSGLLGVSGLSANMRELRQAAAAGRQQARFAVDLYTHKARREVGALTACIGGLDVLVFTAGIGENDAQLRHDVCHGLSYLGVALDDNANQAANGQLCPIHSADSRVEIWVCPTDEGKNAAEQAWALLHA